MKLSRFVPAGITPANVLAAPVFWVMLLWNLLANYLDSVNTASSNVPGRLLSVAIFHAAHWLVLWGISRFVKLPGRDWSGLPWVLAVLTLAFLRGLGLHYTFVAIGVSPLPEMWVRLLFSVLYVGLGMIVVGLWLHQIRRHNELLASMFAEQQRLDLVRNDAERKILEANQNLISKIKNDLLQRVERMDQARPLQALAELRDAIDTVVRPMSEQLAYKSEPWRPEPVRRPRTRVSWPRVFAESFYVANMHPLLVPLLVVLLISPSAINYLSLSRSWGLLILVGLSQVLMLWVYQIGAKRFFDNAGRAAQTAVVFCGYISVGMASTVLARTLVAVNIPGRPWPIQNLIYVILIGAIVCLVGQSLRAMKRVERDLADTTAEASWEITRIRQLHRELEQGLANKLHGKIQGTLAASYLKLARALTDGEATTPLGEYKQTLVRNILELDGDAVRPVRLEAVLEETVATWANVCQIAWQITPEQQRVIEQDNLLCHSLEDVIPELAFNSVKHGQAKHLRFDFEIVGERTLRMTATDDGMQTVSSGRVGLGSKLLDDCCIAWRRESNQAGTVTSCDLPIKTD